MLIFDSFGVLCQFYHYHVLTKDINDSCIVFHCCADDDDDDRILLGENNNRR